MSSPNDPFSQTLVGWQGSAIPWSLTVQNPDTTPIDVSGWVVMFTVKSKYSDPDSAAIFLHDFTMPAESTTGVIGDEVPDTITQNLGPGSLPFDIRVVTLTSSEPQMLMAGQIIINKTVGTRLVPNFAWTPPT
jgi:hypothetical protein